MKRITLCIASTLLALGLAAQGTHAANWTAGMTEGKPEFKSMGPLAFGPDGILFVADTKAAAITAIATGDTKPATGGKLLKVEGVNQKIAALLGTSADQVSIKDMAVNPISHNTYLALLRGNGPDAAAVLVMVKPDSQPEVVSMDKVKFSRGELPNAPGETTRNRQVSITDIAFVDDRVLIAGMSNEEFASTFRAIPFPFKTIPNGTSVEIYHGAHGAFETRSPIRTFVSFKVGNEPQLLAAYQCTPLVQFPVKDLVPNAKIKGKTIAELGMGNNPLDMIVYSKDNKDYLLMANSSRGIMKITTEKIEDMENIVAKVNGTKGLAYETIKDWTNVEQLDRFDQGHALVLRRGEGGSYNIESLPLP